MCFSTLIMENWRLLMRICPNVSGMCCSDDAFNWPFKVPPYLYGVESSKSMKFPIDPSFVT